MAYLQVNRDGTEWISSEPLIRFPFRIRVGRRNIQCSIEQQDSWVWPYMVAENCGEMVELPGALLNVSLVKPYHLKMNRTTFNKLYYEEI